MTNSYPKCIGYEINHLLLLDTILCMEILFLAFVVIIAREQFIEVHGTDAETSEERGLRHAPSEMED